MTKNLLDKNKTKLFAQSQILFEEIPRFSKQFFLLYLCGPSLVAGPGAAIQD